MWRIFIQNERKPGVFVSVYAARQAAMDIYEKSPDGEMLALRLAKRLTWKQVEPHVEIEVAYNEWIYIEDGETPDDCAEPGSVLFVDKKNRNRHIGSFDEEDRFIEDGTGTRYGTARVLCFMVIEPEDSHE